MFKRFNSVNFVDVEISRRFNGSNWVDTLNKRFDGSNWIDFYPVDENIYGVVTYSKVGVNDDIESWYTDRVGFFADGDYTETGNDYVQFRITFNKPLPVDIDIIFRYAGSPTNSRFKTNLVDGSFSDLGFTNVVTDYDYILQSGTTYVDVSIYKGADPFYTVSLYFMFPTDREIILTRG